MKAEGKIGTAVFKLFRQGAGVLQITNRSDGSWQIDVVDPIQRVGEQIVDESLVRALVEVSKRFDAR